MKAAGNCELKKDIRSERDVVWLASDCSDGELKAEHLALTLASNKLTVKFENAFDQAQGLRWLVPILSVCPSPSNLTLAPLEHVRKQPSARNIDKLREHRKWTKENPHDDATAKAGAIREPAECCPNYSWRTQHDTDASTS